MPEQYLNDLIKRYAVLQGNREHIAEAYECMKRSFSMGKKLLIAGNGGSASDAEHIVGELMKGFLLHRRIDGQMAEKLQRIDVKKGVQLEKMLQNALPAIALCNHNSLNTAFLNDVDGDMCFAQQVYGYGLEGDVLLAVSTSGNSRSIIYAAVTAKAKGMHVIGLTGKGGGELVSFADVLVDVEETEAYKVQELHLPIYHCLCMMLEEHFFSNTSTE